MHLVHLFQIAGFTVNTLYRSTYSAMHVLSLHFSSSFTNSLFHKIYRAGCKTSAIWACKHWIFLFLAVAMNRMVWSKNIWKINLSKLRSCKPKPTRYIQNNECTGKSSSSSEESVSLVLVFGGWNFLAWLWLSLLLEVSPSAIHKSQNSFVFTGWAHQAYLSLGVA